MFLLGEESSELNDLACFIALVAIVVIVVLAARLGQPANSVFSTFMDPFTGA